MERPTFKITEFEGPLDLLLYLISKHKLNIYDIEISVLLTQYMDFLQITGGDMEIASEFLEMAARLVHIKTVMLLPKHEEEGGALKDELTGQLMEYQACQELAARLRGMMEQAPRFVRRPEEIEIDKSYTLTHSPALLLGCYLAAMGKVKRRLPPPPSAFSNIVARRVVSVASRIIHLLKRFYKTPVLSLTSVFEDGRDRPELVATFMALLELIRGGTVSVSEDGDRVTFHKRAVKQ